MLLNRRDLLLSFGAAALGLLGRPQQAFSMGGTLPDLGEPAPDFMLSGVVPGGDGAIEAERSLRDFQGQWLVLYFYPRDFTEGCTIEAKGFQRDLQRFHALNAEVVGISADDTDSHKEFCGSEALTYPLLSDPGGQISKRYGSWIPPFSQRHTFLIDPEGVLKETWLAVRPLGHSREILERLEQLQAKS
ncbi:peroxiredoxin [Synechococcus sp. A10-1-5-1]|nr:peroxiredoxin [Synechococcus sp. A10-1-5-1]UPM50575.1 peroxiredoxin [Synechococcus sp. A10-1-5-1]